MDFGILALHAECNTVFRGSSAARLDSRMLGWVRGCMQNATRDFVSVAFCEGHRGGAQPILARLFLRPGRTPAG